MTTLIKFTESVELSGFTLIVPSVSVGNVPQLAIDLLISNCNFRKIATVWHPAIIASVGCDPYEDDTNEICTACELYANLELKLVVMQLRSGLDYNLAMPFFKELKNEITRHNLKNVCILESAFDYELRHISGAKFYYLTNENLNTMENHNIQKLQSSPTNGCGFGKKLYDLLSDNLPLTLLLKYVAEGDNRLDAFMTLEKLFIICKIPDAVKISNSPSSWKYVFGGPPPVGIY